MGGDSFFAKTLEPAPLAKWTPAKPNYIIGAPPFFRGWQAFKYMRKQHEEKRLDDVICALQGVGVLSLSATPSNAPMWEFYADKQTGMVIKFDTHNSFFRNYLSDKWFRKFRGVFHLGRVKYKSHVPMLNPLQSRSLKEIIFSKGNDWSYEQEWRICRPLAEAAYVIERKPFQICLFSIPPSCIKAVLFGKNMKMEERDERISSISSDVRYNHIEMYMVYFEHGAYAVRFQKIGALKERQRNNTVMCINSDGTVAADSEQAQR